MYLDAESCLIQSWLLFSLAIRSILVHSVSFLHFSGSCTLAAFETLASYMTWSTTVYLLLTGSMFMNMKNKITHDIALDHIYKYVCM